MQVVQPDGYREKCHISVCTEDNRSVVVSVTTGRVTGERSSAESAHRD